MKLILYSLNDIHAKAIKIFLNKNNLKFREITQDNPEFNEIKKLSYQDKISVLKEIRNHNIHVMIGFNELILNQLVEHIKKYNPKIEV